MDFFTFSLNNVLRDKESYVAFWLSSVFSIVVFFVFSANMNHPQLAQIESIQDIMRVAAAFIAVYSLGFLGLSLNAFLKRKRRLYGALRTMGMTKRQVALSIMLESLLIGASAIAVGLVFGHLMVMLMARIIRIEDVAYQFPIVSIVQTAATFVVIFLVASAVQARGICRRPIVELLASKVDESRGMRFSKPLAILGIALLACGCGACLFGVIPPVRAFLEPHDELAGIIPWFIVGCTFAGIFLVYRQFSFLVLSWLARSRYYFEEGNAIWMSGLRDRIKGSVMTMFVSTVMLAMSFSAIIVSLAFVTTNRADVSQDIPFGIGYFSYGDNVRESSDIDEIETQLDANGVAYAEDSYGMLQTEKTIFGTKFIAQSAYERQSGTTLALDDGQAVGISGTPDSEDSVEAPNGVSFKVVGTSAPVLDDAKRFGSYVVTDADWQRLHEAGGLVNVRAFIFDVDDEGQAQEVRTACESMRETIGFGLSGGGFPLHPAYRDHRPAGILIRDIHVHLVHALHRLHRGVDQPHLLPASVRRARKPARHAQPEPHGAVRRTGAAHPETPASGALLAADRLRGRADGLRDGVPHERRGGERAHLRAHGCDHRPAHRARGYALHGAERQIRSTGEGIRSALGPRDRSSRIRFPRRRPARWGLPIPTFGIRPGTSSISPRTSI
ncbi:ABC transporter permease [Slackia exigua]|uniref:ABC transporter permease n=1 Tax=Slackia exigua TaxID=84109 RepID=UPI00254D2F85|nr:ABC transporter permease [Slackia exigua]MDK7723180.1 ABC transporter permease [Slackia exigua]MDK7725373.1 ABC transporter permease [Slackia exigua]